MLCCANKVVEKSTRLNKSIFSFMAAKFAHLKLNLNSEINLDQQVAAFTGSINYSLKKSKMRVVIVEARFFIGDTYTIN